MKRRLNKPIILLILFISIGFAYLTVDLSIKGIATLKRSVWDVHFENIVNENENVLIVNTPAVISDNNLQIDFEVTLDQPGQEYSFYVDVVNNSTFDVAYDSLTITGLSNELQNWIKTKATYSDGISLKQNDILVENSKETLRVSIKYNDDLNENNLPAFDNNFTISLGIKYNQADTNSKERKHIEFINRQLEGEITTGDEIAIDTEHFYVISSDEEKTFLLSKYNLKLGYNYTFDNYTKTYTYSAADNGYGLQDQNMKGFKGMDQEAKGTINFSNSTYWYDNGIKEQYQNNIFDNYIYDASYNSENNYSLAYYINNYKNTLEEMGANIINARLLSKEEAVQLGCSSELMTCGNSAYSFVYETSYWLGSSNQNYDDKSFVYTIFNSQFRGNDSNDQWYFGVRPLIEISTKHLPKAYKVTFNYNYDDSPNPRVVSKKVNEDILSIYDTTLTVTRSLSRGSYRSNNMSIHYIEDSEAINEEVIQFIRNANSDVGGGYYYSLSRLPIGEPFLEVFRIKGKGSWSIGQEQGGQNYLNLGEEYTIFTKKYNTNSYQYSAIIFYENSLLAGAYVNIDYFKLYHLLPDAIREGYTFLGWYTDPTSGTRINSSKLVQSNETYYAHWQQNS